MTSWPESPSMPAGGWKLWSGRSPAERKRQAGIRPRGAVLRNRALRLCTAVVRPGAARYRSCQAPWVAAPLHKRRRGRSPFNAGERRGRVTVTDAGDAGGSLPKRHVEQVVQWTPFLNVNGEVGLAIVELQLRRRHLQRRANAFHGIGGGPLRPRWRRTGNHDAGESPCTQAHTCRTCRRRFRPVRVGGSHAAEGRRLRTDDWRSTHGA